MKKQNNKSGQNVNDKVVIVIDPKGNGEVSITGGSVADQLTALILSEPMLASAISQGLNRLDGMAEADAYADRCLAEVDSVPDFATI